MAHAFKIIPAKPTFGTLRQNTFQSDYITNKKSRLSYCNAPNKCSNKNISGNGSYNQMNLFNNGRRLSFKYLVNNRLIPFNKYNLIAGLYTKMDMTNVCSLINGFPCNNIDTSCSACQNEVSIDFTSTVPFSWTNTIDPVGALFGKTACGIENFTNYMKYTCE
jgi:hypothetical protein